jgi:uncharacterized protein
MGTQNNLRVDYIEFGCTETAGVKAFYSAVFGWTFTDYGPDYTSFEDGRLGGGFTTASAASAQGPLVVIYAADLEGTERKVVAAGGTITVPIFSFPGGRRFHFADVAGNVLAVWSE